MWSFRKKKYFMCFPSVVFTFLNKCSECQIFFRAFRDDAMILPPSPSSMSILKRGSSRLWGRMCDIDVEGAKSKKGNAIFETNFLSHIFFEFLVFVAIVGKISSSSSQSRRKNSKIH